MLKNQVLAVRWAYTPDKLIDLHWEVPVSSGFVRYLLTKAREQTLQLERTNKPVQLRPLEGGTKPKTKSAFNKKLFFLY